MNEINTFDMMVEAQEALDRYKRGEMSARDLDSVHKILNFIAKMAALHLKHTQLSGEKPGDTLRSFSIIDSRKEIAKALKEAS